MYGIIILAFTIVGLGITFSVFFVLAKPKPWKKLSEIWFVLVLLFIAAFLGWGGLLTILQDWFGVSNGFLSWLDKGWGVLMLSIPSPIYYCWITRPQEFR